MAVPSHRGDAWRHNPSDAQPRVGIGVLVTSGDRVLLGKRKNAHGSGTWSLPGGHLEYGESWQACAQREVLEETGLVVESCRFVAATNDIMADEGRHYVTLFMLAETVEKTPELCEPDKCEGWQWFFWDALPEPLFSPLRSLLNADAVHAATVPWKRPSRPRRSR